MSINEDREFVELKQQFLDYRDRQMEANVDIKARLTSIDASISALAPVITQHQERFNTMDQKCLAVEKNVQNDKKRIDRLEMGVVGTLVTLAAVTLTGVWQHVFPSAVK